MTLTRIALAAILVLAFSPARAAVSPEEAARLKTVMTTDGRAEQPMPYYLPDGSPEQFAKTNDFWLIRMLSSGPALRAGEAIAGRENLNGDKSQAWVYLTGQRPVRKLPNPYLLLQPAADAEVLGKHHLNPDHVRWELHRVWMVDATLRQGQRHQAPKARYYCDEDTWTCVLADRWDANGQLWKTAWAQTFVAPDLPDSLAGGGVR